METQTTSETYITSQGEIIRREVNKDTLIEKKEVTVDIAPSSTPTHGVFSDLWHTATGGVAHMAEMAVAIAGGAAHNVKEVTTELLGQGIEKAHTVSDVVLEQAHVVSDVVVGKAHTVSDVVLEQTKELVTNLEHMVEKGAEQATKKYEEGKEMSAEIIAVGKEKLEEAKELAVEASATITEQAKEISHDVVGTVQSAGAQLAELAEIVIEQGIQQGEKLIDTAAEKATEFASTAQEKGAEVVETVQEKASEVVESAQQKSAEVVDSAQEKTAEVVSLTQQAGEQLIERGVATFNVAKQSGADTLLSGEALTSQPTTTTNNKTAIKRSSSKQNAAAQLPSQQGWGSQALTLTMDVVSHIQRIADRTGDAVLHETARKAHSACAKGLSEAPGVHLTWVTPQQANDLVNLAIRTQDHELADFARYCQSVAATTHIAVEPTPGKIQEEILKGYQELQSQGRLHVGPGYGAAFASVNKTYSTIEGKSATNSTTTSPNKAATPTKTTTTPRATSPRATSPTLQQQRQQSTEFFSKKQQQTTNEQGIVTKPADLVLSMDVVSHIQRIADRTANPVLHETARRAHSAFAKGVSEAPGVHLTWVTPAQASELMNLASKTQEEELIHFARYCQSVAATSQIAVEPTPGKIQQEIMKGRFEVQQLQQQHIQSQ